MIKKLTLLAMSAAALVAFAAPVTAQAKYIVETEAELPATNVTAMSTNTKLTTTVGTLECTTVELKLHLTTNNAETAHGTGTGTAAGNPLKEGHAEKHTGPCRSSTGASIHFTNVTVSTVHLKQGGTGTVASSYTFHINNKFHCTLSSSANVTYAPTAGNTLNMTGTLSNPAAVFPCPKEGTIHGTFHVGDEAGTPVQFH